MKNLKLQLKQFEPDYWLFLDYGGGDMELMEKRIIIHYRKEHNDYEIIHSFPFTNEKGIDGEIEELKLAREAIKIIKGENDSIKP